MRFTREQKSFSRGEFSPDLILRDDTKAFDTAAKGLANCVLNFEGKASRWAGLRYRAVHRRCLLDIPLDGATVTNPNTGAIGTTNPFVAVKVAFPSAQSVTFMDIADMALSEGSSSQFRMQYSTDDAAWHDFGAAISLATDARTRRRWSAAGIVVARYWRLARIGATDLGAAELTFSNPAFTVETGQLSAARRFRFAAASNALYRAVASDRNLRIFNWPAGEEVANIPIPHTSAQLAETSWAQNFDTGLLFHEDVAPWRIFRQGSDYEWDTRAQAFTNIPQFDYGAGTGGQDEVQKITRIGSDPPAGVYTLTLSGETTGSFAINAYDAPTAAAIQALLNQLDNVAGDIVVAETADGFTFTFTGGDGDRPWPAMTVNIVSGEVAYSVTRETKGRLPGEDVMSNTRGWPSCGNFYQSRLYLGGFKNLQDGLAGSVVGEYFNLDDRTDRDDRGFLRRMQSDLSGTIRQIHPGAKLMLFTDAGTFYQQSEPVTPSNIAFANTNSRGASIVPVSKCDDATLAISESGQVLDVTYSLAENRFTAEPINVLSAHLFSGPLDAAARKPNAANDPNLYAVANSDGRLAVLSSLRSQELTGWAPRGTQGSFLALNDDLTGEFWFVVERNFGGFVERYIESEDAALFTDCATVISIDGEHTVSGASQNEFSYVFTSPASDDLVGVRVNGKRLHWPSEYTVDRDAKLVTLVAPAAAGDDVRLCPMVRTVTGLSRFNLGQVWIIADDQPEEAQKTVAGGSVTLDVPADTSIEIGLGFVPQIDLLPVRVPMQGGSTSYQEPMRIVAATLEVENTAYLEVSANGGPWRPVSMRRGGDGLLDVPLNQAGFTGARRVEGLRGWSREGLFSVRQSKPSPFALRGVKLEVVM